MDINEARAILDCNEDLTEEQLDEPGRRFLTAWAEGYISAWDSQQATIDKQREEIERLKKENAEGGECRICGKFITKDEGGTVFTRCEKCWGK